MISALKDKVKNIKYIYVENLLQNKVHTIINNYREIFIKKIPNTANIKDDEKFNFICKNLDLFGNLPRFISLLINKYDNIFDILNNEYVKIFKKIILFYEDFDSTIIVNLKNNDYFSQNLLKGLSKNEFIQYLNNIPIKYINYYENNDLYFLSFIFKLCEIILNEYIVFIKDINTFNIRNLDQDYDKIFEFILKIYLRVFGVFDIDGYIEVNSIIELILGENYKYVNSNYFEGKKSILFAQLKRNAKSFDFCIYRPVNNIIILLQSKYLIDNNNTQKISFYESSVKKVKKAFETKFNVNINRIYLFYISSYEYNINRTKEILKCLNLKQINCIFFNVKEHAFSLDFQNICTEIPLPDSSIVYPFPKIRIYKNQWEDIQINTEDAKIWNDYLNKKRFRDIQKNKYMGDNTENNLLNNLFEQFKSLITFEYKLEDELISHLGQFVDILLNHCGKSFSIPDCSSIYIFVFQYEGTIESGNINKNKELYLIYLKKKSIYHFDIKSKEYLEENDFYNKFKNYSYAIGKYIK